MTQPTDVECGQIISDNDWINEAGCLSSEDEGAEPKKRKIGLTKQHRIKRCKKLSYKDLNDEAIINKLSAIISTHMYDKLYWHRQNKDDEKVFASIHLNNISDDRRVDMMFGLYPHPSITSTLVHLFKYCYDNFPMRNDTKNKDFFQYVDKMVKNDNSDSYKRMLNTWVYYFYGYHYVHYVNTLNLDPLDFSVYKHGDAISEKPILFNIEGQFNAKKPTNTLITNVVSLFKGVMKQVLAEPNSDVFSENIILSDETLMDIFYNGLHRSFNGHFDFDLKYCDYNITTRVGCLINMTIFVCNLIVFASTCLKPEEQ